MKIIILIFSFFIAVACHQNQSSRQGRTITDMLGRQVEVPDTIRRIIGIRPGTVRLLAYMDAIPLLKGIEEVETRGTKPYNMAYPELASLPIIGPMHGGDAELIAAQKPDIIFSTYMSLTKANELQSKTGIPVIALQYGDLGENKTIFYNSLSLIGDITGKTKRSNSLIAFFEQAIEDLNARTNQIAGNDQPIVYIGGVSSRGAHGITSTVNAYEPFIFIKADNIAQTLKGKGHAINIDIEQLIKWNPNIVFLDCAGLKIIRQEIKENPEIYKSLKAFRDSSVYLVQPHNWYATNFGTVLINAYYVGKIIYPRQFSDINLEQTADSIYSFLFGSNVFNNMIDYYGGYSNYRGY